MPTLRTDRHRATAHLRRHHRRRARCAAGAAAARLCRDRCIAGAPRSQRSATWATAPLRLSQRGYSPGARPDPREFSHYLIDRLMDDAMAIVAASGYGDARVSSGRPRLGRQHRLGARRPPPRTAGLAHHSLAAAPERVQSRAANGRRRSGAPLAAPQGVSGTGCRRCRARRQRQMAARSPGRQRRSRRARSRRILPCSATRPRWRRRSPGIARAARSAARSARSGCRRSISGAMPTTPSAAPPPKARWISSPRPISFEVLPGVGHFAADQAPERVCELRCWRMSKPTRPDGTHRARR